MITKQFVQASIGGALRSFSEANTVRSRFFVEDGECLYWSASWRTKHGLNGRIGIVPCIDHFDIAGNIDHYPTGSKRSLPWDTDTEGLVKLLETLQGEVEQLEESPWQAMGVR